MHGIRDMFDEYNQTKKNLGEALIKKLTEINNIAGKAFGDRINDLNRLMENFSIGGQMYNQVCVAESISTDGKSADEIKEIFKERVKKLKEAQTLIETEGEKLETQINTLVSRAKYLSTKKIESKTSEPSENSSGTSLGAGLLNTSRDIETCISALGNNIKAHKTKLENLKKLLADFQTEDYIKYLKENVCYIAAEKDQDEKILKIYNTIIKIISGFYVNQVPEMIKGDEKNFNGAKAALSTEENKQEALKNLIKHINLNIKNSKSPIYQAFKRQIQKIIFYAVQYNCYEVVELFAGHIDLNYIFVGDDNNLGDTLLHIAAKNQNIEIVQLLLKHGADVDLENNKRKTAKQCSRNNIISNIIDLQKKIDDHHKLTEKSLEIEGHAVNFKKTLKIRDKHYSLLDVLLKVQNSQGDITSCFIKELKALDIDSLNHTYFEAKCLQEGKTIDNFKKVVADLDENNANSLQEVLSLLKYAEGQGLQEHLNHRDPYNLFLEQQRIIQQIMFSAIENNDEKMVEILFASGYDINLRDKEGNTCQNQITDNTNDNIKQMIIRINLSLTDNNNDKDDIRSSISSRRNSISSSLVNISNDERRSSTISSESESVSSSERSSINDENEALNISDNDNKGSVSSESGYDSTINSPHHEKKSGSPDEIPQIEDDKKPIDDNKNTLRNRSTPTSLQKKSIYKGVLGGGLTGIIIDAIAATTVLFTAQAWARSKVGIIILSVFCVTTFLSCIVIGGLIDKYCCQPSSKQNEVLVDKNAPKHNV